MINEKTGEICSTNFKRAQNYITFHVLLQIVVIKQANSPLLPALKFVRDCNVWYNAIRFGALQVTVRKKICCRLDT